MSYTSDMRRKRINRNALALKDHPAPPRVVHDPPALVEHPVIVSTRPNHFDVMRIRRDQFGELIGEFDHPRDAVECCAREKWRAKVLDGVRVHYDNKHPFRQE